MNHAISQQLLEKDYLYRKLKQEHDALENRIESMRAHPSVDSLQLVMLKKKKLMVSDQMERIQAQRQVH